MASLILLGQLLVLHRAHEEPWTVKHKMLGKFYKKHEISNALDTSENGVMF